MDEAPRRLTLLAPGGALEYAQAVVERLRRRGKGGEGEGGGARRKRAPSLGPPLPPPRPPSPRHGTWVFSFLSRCSGIDGQSTLVTGPSPRRRSAAETRAHTERERDGKGEERRGRRERCGDGPGGRAFSRSRRELGSSGTGCLWKRSAAVTRLGRIPFCHLPGCQGPSACSPRTKGLLPAVRVARDPPTASVATPRCSGSQHHTCATRRMDTRHVVQQRPMTGHDRVEKVYEKVHTRSTKTYTEARKNTKGLAV